MRTPVNIDDCAGIRAVYPLPPSLALCLPILLCANGQLFLVNWMNGWVGGWK